MRGLDSAPSLAGKTIVLLESRRAREAADLVRRYGGEPWSVPVMREAPLENRTATSAALRQLIADGAGVIICLTGVGSRALFDAAREEGLEQELRRVFEQAIVVVRGPKPSAALRELGVRIDRFAAEPNTSAEVLTAADGIAPATVAVQLYGQPDPLLSDGLGARGHHVLELPIYRYALAEDLGPVRQFLSGSGRADALAVTSATQLHNLFQIAENEGQTETLEATLRRIPLASIGPVASAAIREHGLEVTIQPEHASMGALIREIARHFGTAQ